ncbi:hypothetical protein [Clostridium vincentii]|uniref:Uncharacterized protein n=1 Tax=Clostridium vincentii TaxID=52704 RepID=A0A2T0B7M7_9CLOT|nr:hypothetical protein [Clostridium vincentii]PRR79855.1 hypothetical protein CLVI_31830 [Clostridium vincentii]
MIKNICVIDDKDNLVSSTYFKRAKQLVKKGRARWLNEDKIKLVISNTYYEGGKLMSNENTDVVNLDSVQVFIEKLVNENSVAEKAIEEISKVSNEDLKAAKILQVVESHDRTKVKIVAAFANQFSK